MGRNAEHYPDPTASIGIYLADHKIEKKHTAPKVRPRTGVERYESMADTMVSFFNGIDRPTEKRIRSVQFARDMKDMERLFWKKKYESVVGSEEMEKSYRALDKLKDEMRKIGDLWTN